MCHKRKRAIESDYVMNKRRKITINVLKRKRIHIMLYNFKRIRFS